MDQTPVNRPRLSGVWSGEALSAVGSERLPRSRFAAGIVELPMKRDTDQTAIEGGYGRSPLKAWAA